MIRPASAIGPAALPTKPAAPEVAAPATPAPEPTSPEAPTRTALTEEEAPTLGDEPHPPPHPPNGEDMKNSVSVFWFSTCARWRAGSCLSPHPTPSHAPPFVAEGVRQVLNPRQQIGFLTDRYRTNGSTMAAKILSPHTYIHFTCSRREAVYTDVSDEEKRALSAIKQLFDGRPVAQEGRTYQVRQ